MFLLVLGEVEQGDMPLDIDGLTEQQALVCTKRLTDHAIMNLFANEAIFQTTNAVTICRW